MHLHSCLPRRAPLRAMLLGAALAFATLAAAAQYPARAIRMVVPFPPGGATDLVSRLIAKSMSDELGQPIVIDNRAGAGGVIGAEAVAKAEPDGYTVLSSTAGVHIVNPAIYPKLPYDPQKSFTPVGQLVAAPLAITVRAESPFKTIQELIAFARANPGKLSYGSAGNGSSLHQNGEMFKHASGLNILHVPYKGAGPAMNDLMGGQVDMTFSYVGSVLPGVQSGKLRMLAVGSPRRLAVIANVPTVAEVLNQPGYDADTWTGLALPPHAPPAVVERLNRAAQHALAQHRAYLEASGYVVLGGTPQQMEQRIASELKTLTPTLAKIMNTL
ncbi:MAG: tripartite tricarboxylate transporter substrate binding protein [Pseudorhodoferax sp.]